MLAKTGSVEEVRKRFVFTTHTPEEAGNEKMDVNTMNTFSFFDGLSMEQVRAAVGMTDNTFNYTLAALRLSHIANGVSKLHGEVSRQMWKDYEGICPSSISRMPRTRNTGRIRNWRKLSRPATRKRSSAASGL